MQPIIYYGMSRFNVPCSFVIAGPATSSTVLPTVKSSDTREIGEGSKRRGGPLVCPIAITRVRFRVARRAGLP